MIYGADSAYAPSATAARQMWNLGWRVYGGYLGGPRATHAWSNADFGRLAGIGFTFVTYYVGRTTGYDPPSSFTWDQGWLDGLDADNLAGVCGFDQNQPITLDAEYGDYENEPDPFTQYLLGFAAAVNAAGHRCLLYSDPRTVAVLGIPQIVDGTVAADYVANGRNYTRPPVGLFDPSVPPAWNGWQFADNGLLAGVQVDLLSFTDDFTFSIYTPPS